MHEITLNQEYLYRGRIVTVRKDTVQLQDGLKATREVIEHAPAVAILAFESAEKIYLVKQFRTPVARHMIEATAGIMNPNEDPLIAAKRELKEETGFEANIWIKVAEAYPAPGFCDEYLHLYLATGLQKGATHMDEDERIETVVYTLDELEKAVKTLEIIDAKTMILFFHLKEYVIAHA